MNVQLISDEAALRAMRPEWDRVLRLSVSDTIFLSWEWITSWWAAYGAPGDLRILVATDHHGQMAGIAPLRARIDRRYGQSVATISFIGDKSNDSEYLDFITVRGREQEVMSAFGAWLESELKRSAVLLLNEVPESSPNLAALRSMAHQLNLRWTEEATPCGTVRLPNKWDDYLRLLKPRFRTKVRSVLRSLEERGDVAWRFCEKTAEAMALHAPLFDLHTRRWQADGKPGVFGWDRKRRFYELLSGALMERGYLRFSCLEWRGRPLACQYGFLYNGVYSHLQEGYEPASEHWNIGIGLRAWTIRRFIEDGAQEYDFLGGVGRHKLDWGAEVKYSKQILIARESWKNRVFCRGPEWERRAREQAIRILPEPLLVARRARLMQAPAPPQDWGAWMRLVGARCYTSLGLPAVTRPLRKSCQLVRRSSRISLKRRSEAVGRILYYHRVNDAGDPFFAATPISVFEREMRHIATHYKVVPLEELLDRLGSASAEPVVAVTFDDGYEDNFTNALPILRRYSIPATIFLTTGAIDALEPLWFEQLAGALKTTDQEHIDLEIDVPRRWRLQNASERARANGEIFALLRRLPDWQRRDILRTILRALRSDGLNGRSHRMLGWDQARVMAAHGITFGGHTVTHPFVSKLAPAELRWEVSECRRRIEVEVQMPVKYFAYPNGREEDFNAASKEALREAGYEAAVSTIWGVNSAETDRMELRRGQPWESEPGVFASKFDWYQWVNG